MTKDMDNSEIKKKVREEIYNMFDELYCGIDMPKLRSNTVMFFVDKTMDTLERELFYGNRLSK